MADAVLHVKVDSSGMVAGASAGAVSLDKLSAAAARSNAATNMLTSAFTSSNVAARNVEVSLRSMLREQTGLARAYAAGSDAVKQYNLQLKIESVLAEAGVAANTMRGRAIAAQVTQLHHLIEANQAAALAQREADAVAGSAKGGLSGLMGAAFGAAAAFAVLKSAATDFARAALEAEDAERRLTSAVERRGSALKLTAADLVSMASKLESVTAFEDDAIQKAQAVLLRFDEIDSTNIESVTKATLDFAEATGQDAVSAATAFGKALLVPGEAMRALKEVGVTLTQQQQDMVDAWNASGQGAKSVSLLVGMLNDKIGGEAEKAALTGAGGLKQFNAQVGNLKEVLGAGLIPDLSAATEVIGALASALGSGKFSMANLLVPSSDFLNELHNIHEAKVAADELALSLKLVGDNGRHMKEQQPFVKPKTKEEIEAAKRAAEEYAAKLQAIVDKANPFSAAARKMAEDVALLKEAFKVLKIPVAEQPAMIARLTGEWAGVGEKLREVELQAIDTAGALGKMREIKAPEVKGSMTIEHVEIPETAYEAAFTDLKSGLQSNLTGAFSYGIAAFLSGSKDATQQFGDALKNVLLNAASEYLSKMLMMLAKELAVRLANVAKEAAARRAASASSGGGGGGGMGGIMQMFGGGGGVGAGTGMSSGMVALGAWVAVAAAAVAILKHQVDRANAVRYQTTVTYSTTSSTTTVGGKLMETGGKIADAFKALIEEIQTSTGALLEGAHRAAIAVRNDKQGFRALVDGVVVGTFKTMDEAIVAAMKKLFSAENLKNQMDPIVQQVVNNFDASKGPQAFAEALRSVTQIVNSLSGLTDIEIQLRDLPANAAQLAAKLHEMGVSIADAGAVAAKWTVQQLQSLRDQITGHQATAAEQMAERQRQAAFFNAQLALNKANMAMKKSEIEHDIEVLKNRINITNTKYELDKWQLETEREFAQQSADIAQYELDVRYAAGEASITLLQAQLEAINQAMAALDAIKPINMGEIRLPGRGGGGASGPSERQQRQEAFNAFLEQQSMSALSDYQRGLAELNKAFDEQQRAAREVAGGEERLAAARSAALHRLAADLIDSFGLPMETARDRAAEFAQKVSDVKAAFAAGQINLDEFLAWFEELGLMAQSELLGMAVYFTDAMGDAVESAKMRKELAQLEWDLKKAEFKMALNMYHLAGAINDADFERWNNFVNNLPDAAPAAGTAAGAGMDLASQAQWFADAMGDTKESVRLQKELADMEWTLKVAAYDLALETYFLNEQITKDQYEAGKSLVERLGDFKPSEHWAEHGGSGGSGSSGPDPREEALNLLTRALDRLRSIVQTYTDFLRGLQTSESSPYSIEQQYNTAQAEYQRLLALAQAGNLDAIEALPNAAQTYLELAAQMFGTASAGYAEIFEGINTDMGDILGGVQSILDSVPTQFRPMEERLDTIAEILQNMYLLQGGTAGTGGGQNSHAGMVYYGPDWGWHPMGWSPGGTPPPDPLAGNRSANRPSLTHANGSLTQTDETNRHLRAIVELQAKALRDGASDRARKPKLSYAGYTGGRSSAARKS